MDIEKIKDELQACKREMGNEKDANNYRWVGYVIGFMLSFVISFAFFARLMGQT